MGRKLFGALCVLILLFLFAVTAYAQNHSGIYVQPSAEDPECMSGNAVTFYAKNRKHYYLFLPSGMDASSLRICFPEDDTLKINGVLLSAGDITDLFRNLIGETVIMYHNDIKTELTVLQSENIPALFLETESGTLDYVKAKKGNKEPGAVTTMTEDGITSYIGSLKHIRLHGNGTLEYDKKPYQIKLEKKAGLFGMSPAKTWILLANAKDISLMRNKIAYDLALEVGIQYAVDSRFVDLYINHEYQGNYLLTQKIEINEDRVEIQDIEKLTEALNEKPLAAYDAFGVNSSKKNTRKGFQVPNDPEDITGGYLMEFELPHRYTNEESGFVTKKGQPVVLKSPEYASQAQVNYIADQMQLLQDAIFADDGVNPVTGKAYYEYADKDSFALLLLLQEVLKNYDANRTSLYFYKPSDSQSSLIYAGPGWDFDQALDNYGRLGANVKTVISSSTEFHWFPHLYKVSDFKQRVCELYRERFLPALSILLGESNSSSTCLRSIAEYKEEIASSARMNFARWGYTDLERSLAVGKDFKSSVAHIQTFLKKRIKYLNRIWVTE